MTHSHRFIVLLASFLLQVHAQSAVDEYEYLHPLPGSAMVSRQTTLIVRPGGYVLSMMQELDSLFSVRGSASGTHFGKTILSDDRKTVVWRPELPFTPSETVFVRILPGMRTTMRPRCAGTAYQFIVSLNKDDRMLDPALVQRSGVEHNSEPSNRSETTKTRQMIDPSLPADYPAVVVNISRDPEAGNLFLSNMWTGNPYLLIVDNAGTPVFYRKAPGNVYDLKVQPNGKLSYYVQSEINRYYIMDSTYTLIDSIVSVHGYTPNEHELRILPNGHMLLIGNDVQTVDMSVYVAGGNPRATVLGNHVLELDAAKNVIFEWRCWDHFKFTDGIDADLTLASFDYVHMNAVEVDTDGNILISSRNMSEITKIERSTGRIMWRMGGKNNQFTFTKDPNTFIYQNKSLSFSYQHDIRTAPGGTYTIFDNGNLRSNKFSRAVEYRIDTVSMTAEMVWQYRHTPDYYSAWMGSVQRLGNGSTLINWADASAPKATEVKQDGSIAFEMDFLAPSTSYRINRAVWKGKVNAPVLAVEPHQDRIRLLFNSFGDTDVVRYNVFAGLSAHPTTRIAVTEKSSLELTALENGRRYYFRVQSVNGKEQESPYSNEVSELVKYLKPGENLLVNGAFNQGLSNWQLDNYDSADSKSSVLQTGECFLYIKKGGSYVWSVQFLQPDLELVYGKKYVFEFDAYASAQRMIDVKVEMNGSPWTNYSRTSTILLPTLKKHFSFPFTMQNVTDYRARVSFNCGISNAYVFLDNIALYELIPLAAEPGQTDLPQTSVLEVNYPNPFNASTVLRYGLPTASTVSLTIYNVLGQRVASLVNGTQSAGWHEVQWNADAVSGLYFYRLETVAASEPARRYSETKKMLLLK
jgi:hypothetical protein